MPWTVGRRQVLVWRADLPRSVSTAWLDDAERRRAASYRHTDDRSRFVLGRTMLRALLGANLHVAPQAVSLTQLLGEAPQVDGPVGDLRWSVSHSGSVVLVAIARRPVGVDVERTGAGRAWTDQEALFKAGRPDGRPFAWRIAALPVGPDHVGSVAAPWVWRLRVVTDGPRLP